MNVLSIHQWFSVTFDAGEIYLNARPPNGTAWNARIKWENITLVCFRAGDFLESDEIYIFTNERPESYLIPIDADGGGELWNEILKRKLFDAELAIKAALSEGELFCAPET